MVILIDYKNIFKMKKNTIYSLIGIVIIVGGGLLSIYTFFGSFNPFYVVVSGSMVPAPEATTEDGKPKVIVHRISEIGTFLGKEVVTTKGDANPYSIPGIDFPLFMENYVGKVVYVIPKIGTISMILTPPINYIIMAIIIGLLIYSIRPRKVEHENETV